MLREEAYAIVQENAMKCWQEKIPFCDLLLRDEGFFFGFRNTVAFVLCTGILFSMG